MKRLLLVFYLLIIYCANTEKVTEVMDGDSFKTNKGKTIRLLGINAPEALEPGGDLAKEFLKKMIFNKNVQLKKDITEKDAHGRYLCYVYLNGNFVNAEMVRCGLAETRFYPPDTLYKAKLLSLEKLAIRNRKGLWVFSVFQIPDTTGIVIAETEKLKAVNKVISWQDAKKYYGKTQTVEGTIVATKNTGKVCFLNFHKDWRRTFTAVIFSSDFDKFPKNPEDYYLNCRVQVTGVIKEYKGKPQIILKSPSQIQIIK